MGIRSADIGSLTLLFRLPPQHVDDLVLGCDLFTQGGVLSRQVDHLERERLVSVAADGLVDPLGYLVYNLRKRLFFSVAFVSHSLCVSMLLIPVKSAIGASRL